MTDQVADQGEVVQTDDQVLASAMAGYEGKARVDETPAEASADQTAQPEAATPQAVDGQGAEKPPAPQTEAERVAGELAALKLKVSEISATSSPEAVRKLHGEIGNINRTLQKLQQQPATADVAPADDELAAALKEVETLAEEFEDIGGPMMRAIKALASRSPQKATPDIDIGTVVEEQVTKRLEKSAQEALAEEHPDWTTVRDTPEYKAWLDSKTPEFRDKFLGTWNPAVVSKYLTEFKDSLKVKERKRTRLADAVTPQGVPQLSGPSTIPDEQGAFIGYNKGPKRLEMR